MDESDFSKYYKEYLEIWDAKSFESDNLNLEKKYEEISQIMGQYAKMNNQFITIYNLKKQEAIFMSDNYMDVVGYDCTPEQYKKWSSLYWMRDLPFIQSFFMLQLSYFYISTCQSKLKTENTARSLSWYLHNFQLSPPNSKKRNIGLLCSALEISPSGKMEVILIIDIDLSGLIKDTGTWWFEININEKETFSYHSSEKKFQPKPILSKREKEVLLLIEEGLGTKEIAERLFTSSHTIDKHRKNMLEYTGAKDSSSLINIGRLAKMI